MNDLQSVLDELRVKHKVVGATLAILKDGEIEHYSSGLLNLDTRVECTPESVFQIGSIGKLFTATLIMQLLDEGRLELDDRVIMHLPDFVLADPEAARKVTIRQLLNHTSGINGDFFPPDDPEGSSTVSYVRKMCLLTNLYSPGNGPMTYSNSGYVVAGRIVEVLTGMTWQHAVMERICKPLGMPAAFAHPEQALRFRCAIGHVPDENDPAVMVVAAAPYLPISSAPAGAVLSMSAESLLIFARTHMADGAFDGGRILSSQSARRMREDKTSLLPLTHTSLTHWGLGWFLAEQPTYAMAGHDGGTLGQFTYLRTYPERKIAFALLTNSLSDKLFREVERQLMELLLATSPPPELPAQPFEPQLERYVGYYSNAAANYMVTGESSKLELHFSSSIGVIRKYRGILEPYRPEVFELKDTGTPLDGQKICFLFEENRSQASYIRFGIRMGRRCGTPVIWSRESSLDC